MAELIVSFTEPTRSASGDLYYGRALGKIGDDGLWEGWLEFVLAGDEETVRTARETEQSKRDDLDYWAQGLSATYLEGALERALRPLSSPRVRKTTLGTMRSPGEPVRRGLNV